MKNTSLYLAGLFSFFLVAGVKAQFAPAAGITGSSAISKDDTMLAAWAMGCTLQRGLLNIAVPSSGYTTVGDETSAIGKAGENGVVSLGDGGSATLTFSQSIYNGAGFDFAVFENGFSTGDSALAFLEFAFVEVSSDGINFFRFQAVSHIQDTAQQAMVEIDCSLVNNLAGKYVFGYGTPFDLDELKNEPGLDVNHVTHVRVIDVVGSVNDNYASHDSEGHKVNDPYPTEFPSGGFDLDAVGVIHAVGMSDVGAFSANRISLVVSPNPSANGTIIIRSNLSLQKAELTVADVSGRILQQHTILAETPQLELRNLATGMYIVTLRSNSNTIAQKVIVE